MADKVACICATILFCFGIYLTSVSKEKDTIISGTALTCIGLALDMVALFR